MLSIVEKVWIGIGRIYNSIETVKHLLVISTDKFTKYKKSSTVTILTVFPLGDPKRKQPKEVLS